MTSTKNYYQNSHTKGCTQTESQVLKPTFDFQWDFAGSFTHFIGGHTQVGSSILWPSVLDLEAVSVFVTFNMIEVFVV